MLSSAELQALRLSLQAASLGVLLGFPVALGIAWALVKTEMRGKLALEILVSFPLALPPVITGYALLLLLSREGALGRFLHWSLGIDVLFTWVAAASGRWTRIPSSDGARHGGRTSGR